MEPFMVLCQEGRAKVLDERLSDSVTALQPRDWAASVASFLFSWNQTLGQDSRLVISLV